ncbi:MAG: M6 family metalloprotease domain-containing protein [bacterium]
MIKIFCLIFIFLVSNFSFSVPPHPNLLFKKNTNGKMSINSNYKKFKDPDMQRLNFIPQKNGKEEVLVILVEFQDKLHLRNVSLFNKHIFSKDSLIPSVYNYFYEISNGKMEILPGILNGAINWVKLPKNISEYNDESNEKITNLVVDSLNAINSQVDFSQYDKNNDGVVDHVFIIHSGNDEARTGNSNDIWSVCISTSALFGFGRYDNKKIVSAVICAEDPDFKINNEDALSIGTFCHEFCHDLGAPDLYDYDDPDFFPTGWWCLMSLGAYLGQSQFPAHLSGYLKMDLDADPTSHNTTPLDLPYTTITTNGTYSINATGLNTNNRLYKIIIPNTNNKEYFLIENRTKNWGGKYDATLPDSGLIISHVDETMPIDGGNNGLPKNPYYRIWIEDSYNYNHDPNFNTANNNYSFPYADFAAFSNPNPAPPNSVRNPEISFNATTIPNTHSNKGNISNISIYNLITSGNTMTFSVKINTANSIFSNTTMSINKSYPNPFNPECYIPLEIANNKSQNVKIKIYNILGQVVREVITNNTNNSVYWDGRDNLGKEVSSGMYFYETIVNNKSLNCKKMLMLK